ncbi:MAG: ABC transporter substrate-binding protein [Candidatus Woesearchaeota archaeon]|nr:ABC transporter substrate-binding protein [Candidatus Woesearchaeota archaeon]
MKQYGVLLLLILAACAPTDEIRVGYLPVLVNLPLFVALEEGYFEKYNVNVEAVEAQSPNHIVEAIIAGHLDGAGILAFPILFAAEEKYPGALTLFATTDETREQYVASILVLNNSNITNIADLKGKKIGVYTGLVQVLFLKSILTGMGFHEGDVEIVQISPRLQLQGLTAGHYDALSTVEPFTTLARKHGAVVLVQNPRVRYIQEPFPSVATPIATQFLTEHPEIAQNYVRAYSDAITFINEHPERAKKHLAKYTPISEEVTQEVTLPKFNHYGEENRSNVQRYADWMHEHDLLKEPIDVHAMFGELS